MPDLQFEVTGVEAPQHAASPQLHFKLAISNEPASEKIHSIILHCQIQFNAARRTYSDQEKEKLRELFGRPQRWGQTLRKKLWTHADTTVQPFSGRTEVDLPVACSYDLHMSSAKYFFALEEGTVPLIFLFSGSTFYAGPDGNLQTNRVSWSKECSYEMPVQVWNDMMEANYPNSAWLYLRKDVFERLYAYKRRNGLATWEQTVEALLPAGEDVDGLSQKLEVPA